MDHQIQVNIQSVCMLYGICCTCVALNMHMLCVDVLEGESRPLKIQENVRNAIGGNMTLFCLGFGNDVEYSFLDVLSKENKGLARRIFEASDATLQLQVMGLDIEYASEPHL